ncbi:FKBP-type peptidyl-prolyl cis-trans isomerase [Maribacter sp. X9]|uniref:FKBP-type peptidyl-prolyl cis-trans isomerase n=1 Tax=Maribacter sp. X9 TaxID=3402159 RepID=UPI003AF3A13B
MKLKNAYLIFVALFILGSCKKDDDTPGEVVPPRLLSEVAAEDDAEIVTFLKTHFYNYEEFENAAEGFDFKIKFDTIAGANSTEESLFDSSKLITETISVASSDWGRNDGEVVDHKLYVLVVRQGVIEGKPTIGDNTILRYEGSLLNGKLFDGSSNQPLLINLSGVVRGFGNGVEYFQTGMGPIENGDGTVSYDGYGIGAIFFPSGLGYFSNPPAGSAIGSYTPLVFKIDAFAYEKDTDYDGDGIPSILEDVNNDGNLNNDNTDESSEPLNGRVPNHYDTDDDNDGIPTKDEINLDANGNFVSFRDTDKDGIPDHLDKD